MKKRPGGIERDEAAEKTRSLCFKTVIETIQKEAESKKSGKKAS